ncbi:hypothetical protein [Bifidobacterium aquikefiricola]|uniref:Uncharacterized protein n=1 Tax=Bifidobacterium aquikefiricola TaxID=3059038 RepID=A0AB39U736_9BIFI
MSDIDPYLISGTSVLRNLVNAHSEQAEGGSKPKSKKTASDIHQELRVETSRLKTEKHLPETARYHHRRGR